MGCGVTSQQKTEQITSAPTKIDNSNKNVDQPQNNNNEQNNQIVSVEQPQPEFTYYAYQLIYQLPNAFVYQINNNGAYQLIAYGNLDIMQYTNEYDGSYQLLLQVNTNFFYFLNKTIGILESPENGEMFYSRRHFIFPGIDCNYDICIMNIQQIVMIQYLEAILAENSNLFVPEVQIQQIQPQTNQIIEQQQQQQQQQQLQPIGEKENENNQYQQQQSEQKKGPTSFLSGIVNKGGALIKQGGELIRKGIKATSNFICYQIQKTGDFLRKKLPKTQKELRIDPQIMNLVSEAHQKKKDKFQLTASLVAQVSKEAIEIGKLFGKKTGVQKDNSAVVAVQEAVGVYDGMLEAINVVEQNMIGNVGDLVEDKFGHDAAVLARQGLEMGIVQTDVKEIIKDGVVKELKC